MSDDQPNVPSQPVEYLAISEALLGHPTTGEPVIILSLRPNPPSFFVVNLALPKDQAWRLARDLDNLLIPFVLLASFFLATATGCGARVDLESANWDSSSGERSATSVEVDVLRPQPPEPVTIAKSTEPPPPVAAEAKPLNISGNTIVFYYRGGDTYYHSETHVHLDERPVPKVEKRIVIQREFRVEPPRRVSEQCERLAREHEERVRRWRDSSGGN